MRTSKPRRQQLKVLSSTESIMRCLQEFLLKNCLCTTDVTHAPCFSQLMHLSLGRSSFKQATSF